MGEWVVRWVVFPLKARVLRVRHRKEETVTILRRVPVSMLDMTDAQAPVCVRIPHVDVAFGDAWKFMKHLPTLEWVRHDGSAYWRPLVGPKRGGPLSLEGLDGMRAEIRADEYVEWDDWPFELPRAEYADRKQPLLDEEGLALKAQLTDLDALALRQATAMSGTYATIDGILHRRCDEPVIEVLAVGLDKRKLTGFVMVPKAGHDPASRELGRQECLQVYRPDNAAEASAYAADLAGALRRKLYPGRVFEVDRTPFSRRDHEVLPRESLERYVSRSQREIGELPRPAVEAWLDLRDAAGKDDVIREGFARLYDLLHESHGKHWASLLALFEVLRLRSDRYEVVAPADRDGLTEDERALADLA